MLCGMIVSCSRRTPSISSRSSSASLASSQATRVFIFESWRTGDVSRRVALLATHVAGSPNPTNSAWLVGILFDELDERFQDRLVQRDERLDLVDGHAAVAVE